MRGTIRSIFEKHRRAVLFLVGIAGGFLGGLLGAGGGIVFIFALRYLLGGEEGERGVFAMSLLAVFFCAVSTFLCYTARSVAVPPQAFVYVLPAVAGGICGSLLLFLIDPRWLRLVFGAVVVYSGIVMLV